MSFEQNNFTSIEAESQKKNNSQKKTILIVIAVLAVVMALVFAIVFVRQSKEATRSGEEISSLQAQLNELEKSTISDDERRQLKEDESKLKEENSKIVQENEKLRNMKLPKRDQKIVYLTFDDGPSAQTPKVLEVLDKYKVKGTFFVINSSYNHLMKDIVDKGHTIALHTYSHRYDEVYASKEAYFNDLKKISDVVKKETGVESKVIRFPGGGSNQISAKYKKGIMTELAKDVAKKGYAYFDWNCINGDAEGHRVPAKKQLDYIRQSNGINGQIVVLMHDSSEKATTAEALPKIIEHFQKRGYTFLPLTKDTPPQHHQVNN